MRDAVQHFCEKHLDSIKQYMQKIFVKVPLPVKCTIEGEHLLKEVISYGGCVLIQCIYYFIRKEE